MPSVVIDSFANAGLWSAEDPGGAASTELTLSAAVDVTAPIGSVISMRAEASSGAAGHRFARSFPATDLTNFSELRWWTRSDRLGDGSPAAPIRLRVELGSAALPIGSPGTWHRLVPVARPRTWELTRVSLDGLAPQVVGAADQIRFTVVDNSATGVDPAMTVWLDELIACEPRLVDDVDAALLAELDGQLTIGATPVPARIFVPGAMEPTPPWIKIVIDDVAFSDSRTLAGGGKADFIDTGYRLTRESVAYDIHYRIDPVTTLPTEYVSIVEFVLERLAHRRGLVVNDVELPLDRLAATDHDRRKDFPVLRYAVAARTQALGEEVVVPVSVLELETEVSRP